MGGAQADLLIGQCEKGRIVVWADAVAAELVEGLVFLLGASGDVGSRLQGRISQRKLD